MSYNLAFDGREFIVDVDNHGYRKRFYALEVTAHLPNWNHIGYIGSYYPASKSCGYADVSNRANDWHSAVNGPKTAARLCLETFIKNGSK